MKKLPCRLEFDAWALLLFTAVMLPNVFWFAFPAPNDILRQASKTPALDAAASVFQVLMVAALLVRREKRPLGRGLRCIIGLSLLAYGIGWAAYYCGVVSAPVVLDLCVAPCAAFLAFSCGRRSWIAFACGVLFAGCYLAFGILNFLK